MNAEARKAGSDLEYPVWRKENIPAYLTVLAAWAIVSVISGAVLVELADSVLFWVALAWSAITTMAGMAIMFIASLINLRKMQSGFLRLARGESDPKIPPVWCPVLTAATNAAMELASRVAGRDAQGDS